jgi:hypothetical protein
LGHVRRRIRSTNIHQRRSRTNLFNATNSDSDSGFGVNTIHGPNKGKGPASDFDSVEDVLGFRAFSDEYDLCKCRYHTYGNSS